MLGDTPVVRSLGVEATWATIPRIASDTDWWRWFNAPGGTISLRPDRHGTMRVILTRTQRRRESEPPARQRTSAQQLALLRRTFAGAGWETERVLEALTRVDDLYTEDLGQVHAPRWSQGHIVLLGDAAYCPSPMTGMGTTLAVVGAYILAGELAAHPSPREALQRYEQVMKPWVEQVQKLPPGVPRVANPTSQVGVAVLRTVIRLAGTPAVRRLTSRLGTPDGGGDPFELPSYDSTGPR